MDLKKGALRGRGDVFLKFFAGVDLESSGIMIESRYRWIVDTQSRTMEVGFRGGHGSEIF